MKPRHLLGTLLIAGTALAAPLATSGCQESSPPSPPLKGQVHLTLLHTSDIHSRLFPYNLQIGQIDAGLGLGEALSIANVGGAARISHIIGRERARASRVLHLDGGDCFQGAPVFNFYSGEAEIRTLSAMGVDAMIVANHEFDRGAFNLGRQLQKWANYPVLAANYAFEDPSQPGASPLGTVIDPTATFDLDGLRVGVVGMGNLSSLTSIFDRPNRLGILPLNTTEVAQFYVDMLRPHVDIVVFVTHLGLEVDERMIASTTGIDVILGGHNHIVLQPPKRVRDCSRYEETDENGNKRNYILLNDPDSPDGKIKRYCTPRDVVLAHSGAFAKYVGRLDLVVSNNPDDFPDRPYDAGEGFEVLTQDYQLFPVNETVPQDPIVISTLEPYRQGLDALANLDLLVGYAPDGSRRASTTGGDSPLGNLISTAMWLRLGIQTDFSLTNTTGIRADLVPGPVTVEQMYNIFPFDNSITKMQLSGKEVQELFDFVARRSTGRGCVSQVQIAGARVVVDCAQNGDGESSPGVASHIYIGTFEPASCQSDADCVINTPGNCDTARGKCRRQCASDANCPTSTFGACDADGGQCWQPIEEFSSYELATSNYLAGGGSGFRVLQRNTTQFDTKVQQRDALTDYIRAGAPCGAGDDGKARSCSTDADCAALGDAYTCACPEAAIEGALCGTDTTVSCAAGACVLKKCRDDVASYQRAICESATSDGVKQDCAAALLPCAAAGEQCKYLACVDRTLGNYSDGRLKMVGQ